MTIFVVLSLLSGIVIGMMNLSGFARSRSNLQPRWCFLATTVWIKGTSVISLMEMFIEDSPQTYRLYQSVLSLMAREISGACIKFQYKSCRPTRALL